MAKTATKRDLAELVAEDLNLSKAQAEKAVEAVLAAIVGKLAGGQRVTLRDFGSFRVKERAARSMPMPGAATGRINVPAKRVATFKAADALNLLV
jgi:DNA-binding protein HU-beta